MPGNSIFYIQIYPNTISPPPSPLEIPKSSVGGVWIISGTMPISQNVVGENGGCTTEMNCGYHLVCKISLVALPMLMLASLVRTRLYSWCIHFRARATQLVKFCIPNGTHSSFRSCNLRSPRQRFLK